MYEITEIIYGLNWVSKPESYHSWNHASKDYTRIIQRAIHPKNSLRYFVLMSMSLVLNLKHA